MFWGHVTPAAQLVNTLVPPTPVPNWFPKMLEIVGGQRLDRFDNPVAIPLQQILQMRQEWRQKPFPDFEVALRLSQSQTD